MIESHRGNFRKQFGLALGALLFLILLNLPFGDDPRTHRMAAIAALMAVWWMTEAIPLPATSLMPLVLMPLLKIAEPDAVARSYANDYIFLYVGGFTIALGIERWNLHRRLALRTLALVGDRPRRVVLGFMAATAALSMWISNTATTMMMLPIALSVVRLVSPESDAARAGKMARFGMVLMLSIAYAASIGGMATLVGTPPNIVLVARFHQEFPGAPELSFARWLVMGLPFSTLFLISAWALLVFLLYPLGRERLLGGGETLRRELEGLGPMTRAEARTLGIFLAAALLWIFRAGIPLEIQIGPWRIAGIPGWSDAVGLADGRTRWVSDGTVAMLAGLAMFFIPSARSKGERLMDWQTMNRLPWHVLLLFGGGFALADGFVTSGLSEWVGRRCLALAELPVPVQILAVSAAITFLTELTSNVATANIVLPVLAGAARAAGINPLVLMLPATLASSSAFMLPVATPPNAIVYGTGLIPINTMVRTGLVLNLVGVLLILLTIYFLAIPIWGIEPARLPAGWLHAAP